MKGLWILCNYVLRNMVYSCREMLQWGQDSSNTIIRAKTCISITVISSILNSRAYTYVGNNNNNNNKHV